jgi:y4mF family transcriptional regulator
MYVRNVADIGKLIRQARKKSGTSQSSLASRLGVSQPWLSEVENGKESAEIGMVLRVISLLGLELDLSDPRQTRRDRPILHDSAFPDIDKIVGS